MRLFLSLGLRRWGEKMCIRQVDVTSAFLQSELEPGEAGVLIRPPVELVKAGIAEKDEYWRASGAL